MKGYHFFLILLLLQFNFSQGQTLKVSCTEKEVKLKGRQDPIIIKTCYLKKYKFVETAYPDYTGKYSDSDNSVYVLVNNKYVKTVKSKVFNERQNELLAIINERIQCDFENERSDTSNNDCFSDLDSIPKYKMNDFQISFQKNEMWFDVQWGLGWACRGVDGTIVAFKISEIEKYLK